MKLWIPSANSQPDSIFFHNSRVQTQIYCVVKSFVGIAGVSLVLSLGGAAVFLVALGPPVAMRVDLSLLMVA